jgi:hypothetical protein
MKPTDKSKIHAVPSPSRDFASSKKPRENHIEDANRVIRVDNSLEFFTKQRPKSFTYYTRYVETGGLPSSVATGTGTPYTVILPVDNIPTNQSLLINYFECRLSIVRPESLAFPVASPDYSIEAPSGILGMGNFASDEWGFDLISEGVRLADAGAGLNKATNVSQGDGWKTLFQNVLSNGNSDSTLFVLPNSDLRVYLRFGPSFSLANRLPYTAHPALAKWNFQFDIRGHLLNLTDSNIIDQLNLRPNLMGDNLNPLNIDMNGPSVKERLEKLNRYEGYGRTKK